MNNIDPTCTIKHWPADERPREKLLKHGPQSLSDAELLAIFLRTGIPGLTAVDLARQLLIQFGTLNRLLRSSQKEFCQGAGLGAAKYAQLQAVLEMANRQYYEVSQTEDALTDPDAASRFLNLKFRGLQREAFGCLFLDNQHRPIGFEFLFWGTLDSAAVYPREVIKKALEGNAAAVIFAHNHPSGVSEPSQSDINLTQQLKRALAAVEIRVLDHLIIGDGAPVSMANRGLINPAAG